jgi:hypothetical protein
MQLAAKRIGFHAQADEIVRAEIVQRLLFGQGHCAIPFYRNGSNWAIFGRRCGVHCRRVHWYDTKNQV